MRVLVGSILAFISVSAEAAEPCDEDDHDYTVTKSVKFTLTAPEPKTPLVAFSTDHGFVLYAEQSKYIPTADYRQNGMKGLGPYDFYWWLRSKQPVDLIDLNKFTRRFSHMIFHMMKLVESGEIHVRSVSSAAYLESVHLEWYSCVIGDFADRGGRRLRIESNTTIIWISDWIF